MVSFICLELFLTLKFFIDDELEKPTEGELSRGRLVTLIEQAGGNVNILSLINLY